jgi:hypothetical protein
MKLTLIRAFFHAVFASETAKQRTERVPLLKQGSEAASSIPDRYTQSE